MINKKISVLCLLFVLIFGTACQNIDIDESVVTVGILKSKQQPNYDAIERGFIDELHSRNIRVIIKRYTADATEASAMEAASQMKQDIPSLSVTIAPVATLASLRILPSSPTLFTGILNENEYQDLLNSTKKNKNITGVYYSPNFSQSIKEFVQITKIKQLGYLYSKDKEPEENIRRITMACLSQNVEYLGFAVDSVSNLIKMLESENSKIEGILLSQDLSTASLQNTIYNIASKRLIPVMNMDVLSAEKGGVLLSLDINYYRMGRLTADIASQILTGTNISQMKHISMDNEDALEILLNYDIAKELDIIFDDDTIKKSTKMIRDGKVSVVQK